MDFQMNKLIIPIVFITFPLNTLANGNETIDSFYQAKKLMMEQFYAYPENRVTVYCGAKFDAYKNISLPSGFTTSVYDKRSKRAEAEHVVPAENFGRTFKEWRDGNNQCVKNGKAFKGRKCAELVNKEYRLMQADAYNLFFASGAPNALRSNYNFQMLPHADTDFGSCDFRVDDRKAQPPEAVPNNEFYPRGVIARTYLYMQETYSRYKMSSQQQQLMNAWDKKYPVTRWECEKGYMIQQYQGNVNKVLKERCGY